MKNKFLFQREFKIPTPQIPPNY